MGIIVDVIIVAIILLSTFLAYKKGLVELAIGLVAFLISVVLTFILYQPISNLVINGTGIDEMIEDAIYEQANNIISEEEENSFTGEIIEQAKNEMLPETARTLAVNIVKGAIIIILFVGIRIGLRFVTFIADLIAKLPVLNQINKVGGLIYGILRGVLIIYVFLLLASVSGQIIPENTINKGINQSFVGKVMYENNILNILF